MGYYKAGRFLAAIVVWTGFFAIGLGLVIVVVGTISKTLLAGAPGGLMLVVWGAMAALLGSVSRAIFDIADHLRGPNAPALPVSVAIPLARRDPG